MEMGLRGYVTITQAAREKGVTAMALHYAIGRGDLDFVNLGNRRLIVDNARYRSWHPNPEFQRMGRGELRKPRTRKPKAKTRGVT